MSESVDMILGRLLSVATETSAKVDRIIYRQDNLEQRVEVLEIRSAKEEIPKQLLERIMWGLVALGMAGAGWKLGEAGGFF